MIGIDLLITSKIFTSSAWNEHLKCKTQPMMIVILLSWLITLFEYTFHIPTNRIGHEQFLVTPLKVMQKLILIIILIVFALFYHLKKIPHWDHTAPFILILGSCIYRYWI